MELSIAQLRGELAGGQWISPRRLCVTADGRIVTEDDPAAAFLLVGAGGSLPMAEAERYGLLRAEGRAESGEPARPVGPAADNDDGLNDRTKAELKALAEAEGIKLGKARSNADIIAVIRKERGEQKAESAGPAAPAEKSTADKPQE
jgi:hypothetical protein